MEVIALTSLVISIVFLAINFIESKYVKKEPLSKDAIKDTIIVTFSSFVSLFLVNKFNILKGEKKDKQAQVFVDKPEF
tara:strand:+ start:981 stop:1214 length:234 start_codon:yes stop_codon:yes gene_type:complete